MPRPAALKPRGFVLIISLILVTVLLLLGMAFLGQRANLYQEAGDLRVSSQARAAALAGLEDVRLKLEKDFAFPPAGSTEQPLYCYSEKLISQAGQEVGGYRMTVDRALMSDPYAVLRLISLGWTGPSSEPKATYQIEATLDIRALERGKLTANPNYMHFINWRVVGGH